MSWKHLKPTSSFSDSQLPCILQRPVVTEKSTRVSSAEQYIFLVDLRAKKADIKRMVEMLFKVHVVGVNVLCQKPKVKRFKGILGKRSRTKKAYVTLRKGERIDMETGVVS